MKERIQLPTLNAQRSTLNGENSRNRDGCATGGLSGGAGVTPAGVAVSWKLSVGSWTLDVQEFLS